MLRTLLLIVALLIAHRHRPGLRPASSISTATPTARSPIEDQATSRSARRRQRPGAGGEDGDRARSRCRASASATARPTASRPRRQPAPRARPGMSFPLARADAPRARRGARRRRGRRGAGRRGGDARRRGARRRRATGCATDNDPTAHAEMVAMRAAAADARRLPARRLRPLGDAGALRDVRRRDRAGPRSRRLYFGARRPQGRRRPARPAPVRPADLPPRARSLSRASAKARRGRCCGPSSGSGA